MLLAIMDDARALLDSLMGNTRNANKDERKKSKGGSFRDDSVCKFDLVGFCPSNENLFHNTKRDLEPCKKTHFEISRSEFNAHPDKQKYAAQYKLELLRHLQGILRRCDDYGEKEKLKNAARKRDAGEAVAMQEQKTANDEVGKLYAEAEELASVGDVQGSKNKVQEAEDLKAKTAEYAERISSVPDVCPICGSSKENDAGAEKSTHFSHDTGKIHQGYVLIRKWAADLQALQDAGELKFVQEGEGVERNDDGERRRERSRDRSRSRRASGRDSGGRDRDRREGDRRDADRREGDRRDRDRGYRDVRDDDRRGRRR